MLGVRRSVASSLVCTVGVAKLAASVYQRAILLRCQRVRFREVLSRGTA